MRTARKVALVTDKKSFLLLAALLVGCFHIEETPEKTELGVVVSTRYIPESSHVTMSNDGNGNITYGIDTDPEEYIITIRCAHGTFRLNPFHASAAEMYRRFHARDSVTIHYTELWRVYNDTTKKRAFHDYNFLYAERRGGWER